MNEVEKALRRIRKKLRQAQYLQTLQRQLNDEEKEKVALLADYQASIRHLLETYDSSPAAGGDQTLDDNSKPDVIAGYSVTRDIVADYIQRKNENHPSQTSIDESVQPCGHPPKSAKQSISEMKPSAPLYVEPSTPSEGEAPALSTLAPPAETISSKNLEKTFQRQRYIAQELCSHEDIVFDIAVCDNLIATASRDCTVKVWRTATGELVNSLSSHTEAVTSVLLFSKEESATLPVPHETTSQVLISGSLDSHFRVWLVPSGRELFSKYTFSSITRLAKLPHQSTSLLLMGTTSGRLEVWQCWPKKDDDRHNSDQFSSPKMLYGETHFKSATVAIEVCVSTTSAPSKVLCAADEGVLLIFAAAVQSNDALLQILCTIESPCQNMTTATWLNEGHVIIGDTSSHLKMAELQQSLVSIIPTACMNLASGEFNCTLAVKLVSAKLILATALDVDTGSEFLNFYICAGEKLLYVGSLTPRSPLVETFGRILCVQRVSSASDSSPTFVTGGSKVLLWSPVDERSDREDQKIAIGVTKLLLVKSEANKYHSERTDSSSSENSADETEGDDIAEERVGWRCLLS